MKGKFRKGTKVVDRRTNNIGYVLRTRLRAYDGRNGVKIEWVIGTKLGNQAFDGGEST